MKITDLKIWVTMPGEGRTYVFLRIDTDEGVSGAGEATSSGGGGSIVVGNMARLLRDSTVSQDFRDSLIGEDPERIDDIWHKLYRRFTGGGGRGGFVTTLLSGIDIALWDIKGKVMGRPIYELFGGPVWDDVPLYTHVNGGDPASGRTGGKGPGSGRLHRPEDRPVHARDALLPPPLQERGHLRCRGGPWRRYDSRDSRGCRARGGGVGRRSR